MHSICGNICFAWWNRWNSECALSCDSKMCFHIWLVCDWSWLVITKCSPLPTWNHNELVLICRGYCKVFSRKMLKKVLKWYWRGVVQFNDLALFQSESVLVQAMYLTYCATSIILFCSLTLFVSSISFQCWGDRSGERCPVHYEVPADCITCSIRVCVSYMMAKLYMK